jgi:hypothetical protein
MEPQVLSSNACQPKARSRRLPWLPAIAPVVAALIALFAMVSSASAQSGPEGAQDVLWAANFCQAYGMQCTMGDFNGDHMADILQFNHAVNPTGVYVALSTGSGFGTSQGWNADSFCERADDICKVGDFNGDRRDDVIRFRRSTGEVKVALAKNPGPGFNASNTWQVGTSSPFCVGGEICDVGDYNGDGFADIAAFTRSLYPDKGLVWVALNNRVNGFGGSSVWVSFFCIEQEMCGSGDFNGDGRDDVIVFSKNYGPVYVATSTGNYSFAKAQNNTPWSSFFCPGAEICGVADFNGDGRDDIVTYLRSTYQNDSDPKIGYVYVSLSNGSSFPKTSTPWNTNFCTGFQICGSGNYIETVGSTTYSQVSRTGDYDGDGRADMIRFLHNTDPTGYVYVALTPRPADRWVLSLYIKHILP